MTSSLLASPVVILREGKVRSNRGEHRRWEKGGEIKERRKAIDERRDGAKRLINYSAYLLTFPEKVLKSRNCAIMPRSSSSSVASWTHHRSRNQSLNTGSAH